MVFSSPSSGGLFYNLAVFPLRVLFFRGPTLWGYGFGGGSSPENMCQSLTNVRSEFWGSSETTQAECLEILERRFHAFVVGAVALSAFAVAIQAVYLSVNRYFLLKPLNEVNRNLEKVIRVLQNHVSACTSTMHAVPHGEPCSARPVQPLCPIYPISSRRATATKEL